MLSRLIGGDLATLARDPLGEFCSRSLRGGVVPLRIAFTRGHLISDPAVVRHVLLDNLANYDKHTPAFDAVRVVLGNGMLTSGGAFWKRQRRIAQPAFHGERVRHFGPIISRMASPIRAPRPAHDPHARAGRRDGRDDERRPAARRGDDAPHRGP